MKGERVNFAAALEHWRRARSEKRSMPGTGWHPTCGSAERMYASSAERGKPAYEAPLYDHDLVDRMQGCIRALPAEERAAWLAAETQKPTDKATIDLVERARVRLIMWWSGVPV